MTEPKTDLIKELTESLLHQLLIEAKIEVVEDEENGVFKVSLETEDSGFLIGYHGETIQALQLILSLMVYQKLGSWEKLLVDVGNYREQREEQLKKLAFNIAQKVKFSGEQQSIPNLSAPERRLIHLALADHPEVTTISEGEGEDRKLIIRPK